ncbi:MAG: copper chaperone PCu(A)C [Proteobacteria bacterium]|nr:copper chaperone PCu(A)C [Pseudomonadota bacterium]MBI3497113.1 copper chaperone PCu(A)C [Pseudomonadota bacterium]
MPTKTIFALAFAALLGALPVQADEAGPRIEAAWARATIGRSQLSVAYMTIVSPLADRLVAVATPVAQAQLHAHTMLGDGTMQMRPVDAIQLKPGEPIVLKPNGSYHLMLTGLKQPLKEGDSFPMTLTFEHAGTREVLVKVENARAMAPQPKQGSGS